MPKLDIGNRFKTGTDLVNSFYTTNKMAADLKKDRVEEIPMDLIDDFSNHPFSVEYDEDMKKLEDSIIENGLINPILVRPTANGRYECIEGHRRRYVYARNKKNTISAIIKKLDDATATILMVDSNIYRETIKVSDKAKAYKMKLEAMRTLKTSDADGVMSGRSDELVAKETQESARTIQRLISLNNLVPDLLEMVDEKRIGLSPAYELASLSVDNQYELLNAIAASEATPSLAQAKRLKSMEQEGTLDQNSLLRIMIEPKANQIEKITIKKDSVRQYIPTSLDNVDDIERYIIEALKAYASNV